MPWTKCQWKPQNILFTFCTSFPSPCVLKMSQCGQFNSNATWRIIQRFLNANLLSSIYANIKSTICWFVPCQTTELIHAKFGMKLYFSPWEDHAKPDLRGLSRGWITEGGIQIEEVHIYNKQSCSALPERGGGSDEVRADLEGHWRSLLLVLNSKLMLTDAWISKTCDSRLHDWDSGS